MARFRKAPRGEYLREWDPMARLYWLCRVDAASLRRSLPQNSLRGGPRYMIIAFGKFSRFSLVAGKFAQQRSGGALSFTPGGDWEIVSVGDLPPAIRHALAGWIHANLPEFAKVSDFSEGT